MPRSSTTYVCRECGGDSLRWAGQCPYCKAWNTLEEFTARPVAARHERARAPLTGFGGRAAAAGQPGAAEARSGAPVPVPVTAVDEGDADRIRLDWAELNRVLGGGLVVGSLTLIGGEPGVGKSTLLMHLASQLARGGAPVLYATGEESARQVRMRASRLQALSDNLLLVAENDLDAIIDSLRSAPRGPDLLIVDSIQTVYDAALDASPGSVTQVRESAARLMRLAKATSTPIILVGHVTKEGAIAGPRVLEHMVDTVLYLEGERRQGFRILRATKNRFGSTDEIGVFAMGDAGLEELKDPSAMLLQDAALTSPGTVVVPSLEGTRPLLVEIQSLVAQAGGIPRRSVTGVDLNRLYMIVAILERRGGVSLGQMDVFVNVAGGVRVTEPAADLGLALSIAASERNVALPAGSVVIGELGLGGEVRRVGQLERRLAEATRYGFTRAIIPRLAAGGARPAGLELVEVRDVADAIASVLPPRRGWEITAPEGGRR